MRCFARSGSDPDDAGGALRSPDDDHKLREGVLQGETSTNPTSLRFGPDQRLYVAQQGGATKAYGIQRAVAYSYAVTATETITTIKGMPNHNDGSRKRASASGG